MVREKVIAKDFRRLKLKDFPASALCVKTQKEFENESHAVSADGALYVNKRLKNWGTHFEICKILSEVHYCELEKLLIEYSASNDETYIYIASLIKLEMERRNTEKIYYNI